MADLEGLIPYAAEKQAEYIRAVQKYGSGAKAAEALGVNKSSINRSIKSCRKKAEKHGDNPEHDLNHPAAPGNQFKGASTAYDAEGNIIMQWVKTQRDNDNLTEALQETVEALKEEVPRAAPKGPAPKTDTDSCTLYTLNDIHLGMIPPEGNGEWGIDAASDVVKELVGTGIEKAEPSEWAILWYGGDFLHIDGFDPQTPSSKHPVNSENFQDIAPAASRLVRETVNMALEKHACVQLIIQPGNHDESSAVWLADMFSQFYEDTDRVVAQQSRDVYHCFQWNNVSLFFTHGHKMGLSEVDRTFANNFRKEYGETDWSYAHTAHIHRKNKLKHTESQLMPVESHHPICPRCDYASRSGYDSERALSVICYDQYGERFKMPIRPR
jgi:hypothetical protein